VKIIEKVSTMKKATIYFALIIILLTACTSALTTTPQPTSSPTAAAEVTATPKPQSKNPSAKSDATPKPKGKSPQVAPTASNPAATPNAKPKGQTQPAAPASANPDLIVPEILGRPTNTLVTINVVPARAMDIVVEYGITAGVYDHQSAVSAPGGSPIAIGLDQLQPNTRYY
jgi:hypothetical protein